MHPALFEIPQRLGVAWELPLIENHGLLQHIGRIGGRSTLLVEVSLAYLDQQSAPPANPADVLEQAVVFYQGQLPRHSEALRYLEQRGVHDPALIQELRIGYAPGGNLRQ